MTNTRTLKPVAYFRATKGHGIVWSESCCCEDAIFDGDDDYDEQTVFSLPVYSADVVEALQKENAELRKQSRRYENIRKLNAQQFAELYKLNIQDGIGFDDLVDGLFAKNGE